jgi:hypothetical protein
LIKASGLLWNSATDKFLAVAYFKQENAQADRRTLRTVASIYDPLGFLKPVIISCKMFRQHLWRTKVNWGKPLPLDVRQQWLNIQDKLPLITSTEIDRVAVSNGKKGKLRCISLQIEA